MILGIDASSANKEKRTGVEWYAFHLIQEMKKLAVPEGGRVFLYSPSELRYPLSELPPSWESKVLNWPLQSGWMQGRMSWEMQRRPPGVLFVPAQALPRVVPKPLPAGGQRGEGARNFSKGENQRIKPKSSGGTATTIHDIGFHRKPEVYDPKMRRRLEKVTRDAVKHAQTIFTPSRFTKDELIDVYKVAEDKLVVTPLACDTERYRPLNDAEVRPVLQEFRLSPKGYFLVIGRLELKKNIGTVIRAFEIFKQSRGQGDPFELVFVGSPGFGYEKLKKYVDLSPVESQIRSLGWVPEESIPGLMNGAAAYLFPSWYEGFGIPNLEAMACGTPLITSDIPCHREVAGEAGNFVDPSKPQAWAESMTCVAAKDPRFESKVQLGLERAKRFSWERTAGTTWETLWELAR